MATTEALALSQVQGEMVAEGIVAIEDGVPTFQINGHHYMLEMRAFDVTEEP